MLYNINVSTNISTNRSRCMLKDDYLRESVKEIIWEDYLRESFEGIIWGDHFGGEAREEARGGIFDEKRRKKRRHES